MVRFPLMKISPILFAASCLALLAACASPIAQRIEKHPEVFNALDEHQKELVKQGYIEDGMQKDAVWLAWGRADRGMVGQRDGKPFERWSYTGYEPVHGSMFGLGVGGGYWTHGPVLGTGFFYDPSYTASQWVNVPYEAKRVEFISGRVSSWRVTR